MEIGVCTSIDKLDLLDKLGYDRMELNIGAISEMNEAELAELKERLDGCNIRVKSGNCMFHGSLPQVYLDEGLEKIRAYFAMVMPKLQFLGITTAVFGSGWHRRMPEDMALEERRKILLNLLTVMEAEARKNGITVAIEPLNKKETNMLVTTEEAMSYIMELQLPNLRLLVDLYHFYCEGEPLDRIGKYGPYIEHVHIVEPTCRTFMRRDDAYDYGAFVKALRDAGYDGALMFEGGGENYDTGITETYPILRALSLEA